MVPDDHVTPASTLLKYTNLLKPAISISVVSMWSLRGDRELPRLERAKSFDSL